MIDCHVRVAQSSTACHTLTARWPSASQSTLASATTKKPIAAASAIIGMDTEPTAAAATAKPRRSAVNSTPAERVITRITLTTPLPITRNGAEASLDNSTDRAQHLAQHADAEHQRADGHAKCPDADAGWTEHLLDLVDRRAEHAIDRLGHLDDGGRQLGDRFGQRVKCPDEAWTKRQAHARGHARDGIAQTAESVAKVLADLELRLRKDDAKVVRLLAELIDPLAANAQQLNQLRAHAAAKNLGGLRGALRRIVNLRNLVGQLAENIARIASMTTAILETDAEIAERLLELAAAGVEDVKGALQRPNACAGLLGGKAKLLEILDGRAGPDRAFLDRGGNLRRRLGQLDHGSRQGGRGRADRAE